MDQQEQRSSVHVEQTVAQIGRLYDEHRNGTSPLQRLANRVTAGLGRPTALLGILSLMVAWMAGNYIAPLTGLAALEVFPFPYLEFIATVAALLVALSILTTQRHEDELAEKRARLTLQIATLSEKKIAKIIELLQEQRHDNPMLPPRADGVAQAMATPDDVSSELAEPRVTAARSS